MKKIVASRFDFEIHESKWPVVVLFFTEWSGSAFIIAQMLHELEKQYANTVKFVLVNSDESPELCQTFGIRKIPTILFFREGEVVNQLQGTHSRSRIKEIINAVIIGVW